MARNPIEEAYLRGLGVRQQANMPRTEVDNLFNPYTYTSMNNAAQVASLPNRASDAGTMAEINENYADAPLSSDFSNVTDGVPSNAVVTFAVNDVNAVMYIGQ